MVTCEGGDNPSDRKMIGDERVPMREARRAHVIAMGRWAQCGQRVFELGFLDAGGHGEDDAKSHQTPASLFSTDQIAMERNIRNSHLKGQV